MRPLRLVCRTALPAVAGLLVLATVAGWGRPAGLAVGEVQQPDAARSLRLLTTEATPIVPPDFARVMGYRPVVSAGRLVRPDGSCSSPFGPTAYGFRDACRAHDLGYDLLRYAQRKGQPLGSWARQAVDDEFDRALHGRCTDDRATAACEVAASVYADAVRLNTWRQGSGVPVAEGPTRTLLGLLLGLVVTVLLSTGTSGRRLPLVLAALAFDLALVPTLLPRPWWVNGLFVGVAAAQTYLLARAVRHVVRRVVRLVGSRPAVPVRCAPERASGPPARRWVWAGLGVLLGLSAVGGQLQQARLERSMRLDPGPAGDQVLHQVGSVALAIVTAVLLVGLVVLVTRGVRTGLHLAVRPFRRSRRLRVALLVPVVTLAGCTVGTSWPPHGTPASAATADAPTPRTSRDVGTGGRGTTLGAKGRQFLRGATPAATIARVTGRPARRPVRVYAELRPDEDDDARAARGAKRLRAAGALDRSVVVVVVPTGSGWVDPAAVTAVETLTGGDVATLAVQYADVPSWVAYLQGADRAVRSAAATLREVRALLDAVPATRRPRLLVFGESLGALGGLRGQAASSTDLDGALWVGVPSDAADLAAQARRAGQTVLVHPDDPVAAWSSDLVLGPASGWHAPWWPVVTFWQATADLVSAYSTPDGYGHRYGAELVDAWRPVLRRADHGRPHPSALPPVDADRLVNVRQLVARTSAAGSSLPSRTARG